MFLGFSHVICGLILLIFNIDEVHLVRSKTIKAHYGQPWRIQSNEPVIGVLTQEVTGKLEKISKGQYVLSSYINMLEAAGARVVPFLINQTPQQVEEMFSYINGIVFPGGHIKLQYSKYGTVGKQIFELAKKANDKGNVFPIWAECLGLEMIVLLASGRGLAEGQYDTALFDYVHAKKHTAPLTLTPEAKTSQLFGSAPPEMIKYMTTTLKGFHNHNKAVTMETYKKYKKLSAMFNVLSLNKDRKGKQFISTFEGKKYPFYLLHWHPSKAQISIPVGYVLSNYQQAVRNARYLVGVFVNQARMSKNVFPDEATKQKSLISNFPVIRNHEVDGYFIPM